jgi:hypothetical protein
LLGILLSQSVPLALAQAGCDRAQFVSDVTAPDGSSFAPGATFTKTWRLMNIGTCTWNTAYSLTWVGGDSLSAPQSGTARSDGGYFGQLNRADYSWALQRFI